MANNKILNEIEARYLKAMQKYYDLLAKDTVASLLDFDIHRSVLLEARGEYLSLADLLSNLAPDRIKLLRRRGMLCNSTKMQEKYLQKIISKTQYILEKYYLSQPE